MTTKDQAIAPHMNTCHLCGKRWWGSHVCSFKIRASELVAAFKDAPTPHISGDLKSKPAPDCRTCLSLNEGQRCIRDVRELTRCTNGDQYKPAPAVVLWRTV